MKKKILVKKLTLEKSTVSNLSENAMDKLNGGKIRAPFTFVGVECGTLFECSADFCKSLQQCTDSKWLLCSDFVC